MESVIAALVTGVLTLLGVLVSNSRSHAVMEVKIDNLARQMEKHNHLVERAYVLEQASPLSRRSSTARERDRANERVSDEQ